MSALGFRNLATQEWTDRASSRALCTMYNYKMNEVDELSITTDSVKLTHGLKKNWQPYH